MLANTAFILGFEAHGTRTGIWRIRIKSTQHSIQFVCPTPSVRINGKMHGISPSDLKRVS